jgi:hypothetical protein
MKSFYENLINFLLVISVVTLFTSLFVAGVTAHVDFETYKKAFILIVTSLITTGGSIFIKILKNS